MYTPLTDTYWIFQVWGKCVVNWNIRTIMKCLVTRVSLSGVWQYVGLTISNFLPNRWSFTPFSLLPILRNPCVTSYVITSNQSKISGIELVVNIVIIFSLRIGRRRATEKGIIATAARKQMLLLKTGSGYYSNVPAKSGLLLRSEHNAVAPNAGSISENRCWLGLRRDGFTAPGGENLVQR